MQRYSMTHPSFICLFPVFSVLKYQLALLLYTYECGLQHQVLKAYHGHGTNSFPIAIFANL